jgi:hypothetical protein
MKTRFSSSKKAERGYVLLITVVLLAAAVLTLGGMMSLTSTQSRQTEMNNLFNASVAVADGATEMALSRMRRDYVQQAVNSDLSYYTSLVPNQTDWPTKYRFSNGSNVVNQTGVTQLGQSTYVQLTGQYAGSHGE